MKQMNEQQKYIDLRLDQRDKKLMESIRESQEARQALLPLAASQANKKRKGLLARLFGE